MESGYTFNEYTRMNTIDDSDQWWMNELFGVNITEASNESAYEEFVIKLIQFGALDELFIDELLPASDRKKRKGRQDKINYWEDSKWGILYLNNPEIKDPTTKTARDFRRKFRVPFPVFDQILVPECDRLNVIEVKDTFRVRY